MVVSLAGNGSLIREGDTVRGSALIGQILPATAIFMVARRQQQKCPISTGFWREQSGSQ